MKKIMIFLSVSSACGLVAADYAQLSGEAADALKAKDYTAASTKYEEAGKAAATPEQKLSTILARFNILKEQKKQAEAENLLKEMIEDEMLKEPQQRRLINLLAGQYLWGPKYEEGLSLLKQAQNLACPKTSNDYFQTYYYMAEIYLARKNQPEAALEVMSNMLNITDVHPANLYNTHMVIGRCHEKLGRKETAFEHYKKALDYGKKIPYKYDFSAAEKAIERVSK